MKPKDLVETLLHEGLGPVLAQSEQDGYVLRIHIGADKQIPGADPRLGTMTITSPEGETVQGGYWMDWPENHWPEKKSYYALPIKQRAQLEANEQLRWGLKKNFEFHRRRLQQPA